MGLLDRLKKRAELSDEEEYDAALARESAKVRAYRLSEEVAVASQRLMNKALELRAEIEAMANE